MKNCWVTQDQPVASWSADLSVKRQNPESLLGWLDCVLKAGEESSVYTVHEAPTVNFLRERDGPLAKHLERLFHTSSSVDLFQFAKSGMRSIEGSSFRTFAQIAYFDAQDQITDTDVDDLGLLLRSLRPADIDAAAGLMSRCPPIEITGPRIDFNSPEHSIWAYKADQVKVRFRIFSDIWFPWVRGFLEERFDVNRWYDNRLLAQLHTPRLNGFLSFVSNTTCACGGTWELDEDESRRMLPMLTTDGIRLDVEPPGGVMDCQGMNLQGYSTEQMRMRDRMSTM